MNFKRLISAILAILMITSILLTSCSKSKKPNDQKPNLSDPPVSGDCSHAQTELRNVVEATCASQGYSGDAVCIACGEIVTSGAATAKLDHAFDDGRITKEPTCIETGIFSYFCTVCGTSKAEAIPTVAHDDVFHDALDGGHTITCNNCIKSEYATHTPLDAGTKVEATCTEPAYTLFSCVDCECSYKVYDLTSLAINHEFGDWTDTLEADCRHEGEKSRECSRCGDIESITTPMDGSNHAFSLVDKENATCTSEGHEYYVCEYCNAESTVTLAMIAHSFGNSQNDGHGWTKCSCDVCGYTLSSFNASNEKEASLSASALDNDNFEIKLQSAAIIFPESVVSQFKNSSDELSIKADVLADSTKDDLISASSSLTQEQKDRLNSVDIYEFGVTQGEYVSSFNEAVTVTLPYSLGDDESPEGVIIWYVKEDGTIENVNAIYNEETETVTFSVSHFSYYAIAYEETQEMRCKKGNHELTIVKDIVETNCYSFGYTVRECSCCHSTQLTDIVEKLDHAYGSIIEPTVDCTNGGFKYKECTNSGCSARVTYEYVSALGHKPTAPATCTDAAICSVCGDVVIAAKGHKFTEWEIIVEASGSNDGLKRRFCLRCGDVEEIVIASTGEITDLDFDSYMDMIDFILRDYLKLGKGVLTLKSSNDNIDVIYTITADCDDKNTIFSIKAIQTYENFEGIQTYYGEIIYKNGTIFQKNGENDTDKYVLVTDLDTLTGPYEAFDDLLIEAFDEINPSFELFFNTIDSVMDFNETVFADTIDEIFAKNEIEYTYAEIEELYNSYKKLYAYIAQRLGKDTSVIAPDGVERPTDKDIRNLLDAFMSATTNGDNTVYSFDATKIVDAAKSICDWYFDNADISAGDVFFDIFEKDITEKYPNVTDWTAFITKLKSEFNGNMKLSDATDKLMSYFTGGDADKLDSIYNFINILVCDSGNSSFDIENIIKNNANMTLDELARDVLHTDNIANVFDMIASEMLDMSFDNALGLSNTLESYSTLIDALNENINISITVDAKGNLVSFNLGGNISIDESAFPNEIPDIEISLEFKRDNSISISIPAAMSNLESKIPTASFDESGNLIITTKDDSFDYTLGVSGSMVYDYETQVQKDSSMSEKYGLTVYNLFSTHYESSNIYCINNKFYQGYYYFNSNDSGVINSKYALADLFEANEPDPDLLTIAGRYVDGENVYDVYNHPFGYVYQIDGEWQLIDKYNSEYHWYDEDLHEFISIESISFTDAVSSMRLSTMNSYEDYVTDTDGKEHKLINVTIAIDNENWSDNTIQSYAISVYGEIFLVSLDNTVDYKFHLREISVEDFPEHIYYTIGYESSSSGIGNLGSSSADNVLGEDFYIDGVKVTDPIERVYFATSTPSYFVKVGNVYVPLENLQRVAVIGKSTLTLPDGKTLYVNGGNYSSDNNGNPYLGRVYGYVGLGNGYYVKTAVEIENGNVIGIAYEDGKTKVTKNLVREMNFDSYVTKQANGVYVVSKDFFSKVKNMTLSGYFYIFVTAEKAVGDSTYAIQKTFEHSFTAYAKEDQQLERLDWYTWFENSYHERYTVINNPDGSVSVFFRNGEEISIDYRINAEIEITDALAKYDKEMSNETGLEIYSITHTNSYHRYLIKKGNKYYNYNTYEEIEINSTVSLDKLIKNNWYIDDIYYRYDFIDDNGNLAPVYEGAVRFNSLGWNQGISRFLIVKEGQFYVLTEVEVLGEGGIKFEGMTSLYDFMSALEITDVNYADNGYNKYFVEGKLVDVCDAYITILCPDNSYDTVYIDYLNIDGNKVFVDKFTYVDEYLEISEEVTDFSNATFINTITSEYTNGTFERSEFLIDEQANDYFVKLGGKLYFYDDRYESYMNQRIDEQSFKWYFYDVIYDDNYDPIFLEPEGMKTFTCSDGTVFYYIEGFTEGYIKDQAGYYTSAELITNEYGQQYVYCYCLDSTTYPHELDFNSIFADYVTFSADNTMITFNPGFIEKAEDIFGDNIFDYENISICLRANYDDVTFYSYEIKGWFE